MRNPVGTHVKIGRGLVEEVLPTAARMVLETPGSRDPGDWQIPLLKELRVEVDSRTRDHPDGSTQVAVRPPPPPG